MDDYLEQGNAEGNGASGTGFPSVAGVTWDDDRALFFEMLAELRLG